MINPGRAPYKRHRKFWEQDVLAMGHDLGNHTWHHKGARTIEEADREIGSVSNLILKLRPHTSKLMVFASGGGEKWGGVKWSDAEPGFKEIASNYDLIDLYDGEHPSYRCDSKKNGPDLQRLAESAAEQEAHQPYHFHEIVQPFTTFKGLARGILNGYDLAFPPSDFEFFLSYLSDNIDSIWVAPIINIIKYETEYNNSKLSFLRREKHETLVHLSISVDAELYDHPLTLAIPGAPPVSVSQVIDGKHSYLDVRTDRDLFYADIRPTESDIGIKY